MAVVECVRSAVVTAAVVVAIGHVVVNASYDAVVVAVAAVAVAHS